MRFDHELAEQICRDMQLKFNPEQNGVTIHGEKLSDVFSTQKLFRGEYYSDEEIELILKSMREHSIDTGVSNYDYLRGRKTYSGKRRGQSSNV